MPEQFSAERNAQAFELRKQGNSFQSVAQQMGYPSRYAAEWAIKAYQFDTPLSAQCPECDGINLNESKTRCWNCDPE